MELFAGTLPVDQAAFLQIAPITIEVIADDIPLPDIGANVGFASAQIKGATLDIGLGLQVKFNPELQSIADWGIDDFLGVEISSTYIDAELPVEVTLGPFSTNDFGIQPHVSIHYPDVFNFPLPEIVFTAAEFDTLKSAQQPAILLGGFEELLNFSNMNAAGFVSLLGQLSDLLDGLRDSELLNSIDIPFVQGAIGGVLDFADMLSDALLFDDYDDDDPETGTPKLLNADNSPTFKTAQDLALRLTEILNVPLQDPNPNDNIRQGINLGYDPDEDILSLDLDLSAAVPDLELPIDFSMNLAPLLEINSDATVLLSAEAGLTLTIGMYLGDEAPGSILINEETLLGDLHGGDGVAVKTEPAITLSPLYGRLSNDAMFNLTITDIPTAEPVLVLVTRKSTTDNFTIEDLVNDLNDALTSADIKDLFWAETDGQFLAIRAIDATITGFELSAAANTSTDTTTGFEPNADNGQAFRELGFASIQIAADDGSGLILKAEKPILDFLPRPPFGRLESNAIFEISINGAPGVPVTVTKENTSDNFSVDDVIADLNTALAASELGSLLIAEEDGTRVVLRAIDDTIASFTISAFNPAAQVLGFAQSQSSELLSEGASLTAVNPLFINTPDPSFQVSIDAGSPVTVTLDAAALATSRSILYLVAEVNRALGDPGVRAVPTVVSPSSDTTFNVEIDGDSAEVIVATDGFAKVFFDGATDVDVGENTINIVGHNFEAGQAATYSNGGGTSIVGLNHGDTVYVIVVDHDTIQLAASKIDADDGTAIELTAVGAGAHSLTEDGTPNNSDLYDLAADINRALAQAKVNDRLQAKVAVEKIVISLRGSAELLHLTATEGNELGLPTDQTVADLSNKLYADSQGNQLVLSAAIDTAIQFTVTADAGGPAVTSMGFPESKSADLYDFIIFTRDGEQHPVSLDEAITVNDIITRISNDSVQAALNAAGTGLDLTDLTSDSSTALFRVEPVNGSPAAAQLGIMKADIAKSSETPDGLIEGAQIAGTRLTDRFFIENASVFGNASLSTPNGFSATATFGDFVEIIISGGGSLEVGITAGLKDPGTLQADESRLIDGRISITEFLDALYDDIWSLIEMTSITGMGDFNVGVDIEPDITSLIHLGAKPEINLHVETVGELFTPALITQAITDFDLSALTEGPSFDLDLVFDDPDRPSLGNVSVTATLIPDVTKDNENFYHLADDLSAAIQEALDANLELITAFGDGQVPQLIKVTLDDSRLILRATDNSNIEEFTVSAGAKNPAVTILGFDQVIHEAGIFDIDFDYTDLGDLLNFDNIDFSFSAIIDALMAVSQFLSQFEEFDFLNEPLPLINKSVNDLLSYADQFEALLTELEQNPAGSIQQLEAKLKEAFGLPATSDAFGLSLVTDDSGTPDVPSDDVNILRLDLGLSTGFSETLGIDLKFPEGLFEDNLAGAADLRASGGLDIGLSLGIDLDDPTNIYLFLTTREYWDSCQPAVMTLRFGQRWVRWVFLSLMVLPISAVR